MADGTRDGADGAGSGGGGAGGIPWWRRAVVYQIYPRSFADTSGDGVGDLPGIRAHLDHLRWLGVDGVWLSPIYRSPMADFGYDVADHRDVDPLFGTLDDLDGLVADLHAGGQRLLLDWVPNHTSDRHPWFLESRADRTNPRRDWYVWRDEPNNWTAAFTRGPAWTLDPVTGQHYLHLFLPAQPDLNWSNPAVEQAMHDVLRFWLDRGVDGFRADVVHLIGKDPSLADDPPELIGTPRPGFHDEPTTHDLLRRIRSVLDAYPGDRVMVGEVNLTDPAAVATYQGMHGDRDELHLTFDFGLLAADWDAAVWRDVIGRVEGASQAVGGWPTWVLGNHDQPRQVTRYGSLRRARAAAVVLLTLRGTPFLYAGEELGLADAVVPAERVVDPGARDGCRAPLPWTADRRHGWPTEPWLPFPPDAAARSVESLRADPGSILHLYRRLLALRRRESALTDGAFRLLDAPEGTLVYSRTTDGRALTVAVNFTSRSVVLDAGAADGGEPQAGDQRPLLVSDGPAPDPGRRIRLGPEQAVVLGPT